MHSDGRGSINEALCDTIAAVFPHAATADVAGNTNRELFACCEGEIADRLHYSPETVRKWNKRLLYNVARERGLYDR